jgi:hypothetical protein
LVVTGQQRNGRFYWPVWHGLRLPSSPSNVGRSSAHGRHSPPVAIGDGHYPVVSPRHQPDFVLFDASSPESQRVPATRRCRPTQNTRYISFPPMPQMSLPQLPGKLILFKSIHSSLQIVKN